MTAVMKKKISLVAVLGALLLGFILTWLQGQEVGDVGTVQTRVITPKQWGAIVDDGVDDSNAVNAMFQWMEDNEHGHCVFPPGEYTIDNNLKLPYKPGSTKKRLAIQGHGAILQTNNDNVTIFDRKIDSVSPSPTGGMIPLIEGFSFRGQASNTATSGTGILYHGSHNLIIRHCTFDNLNKGIELVWCMGAVVDSCLSQGTLNNFIVSNGDGPNESLDEAAFDLSADTMDTDSDHGLATNDRVQFTTAGTLPGGLSASTNYYAIVIDSDTFAVSAIEGSTERVDITSTGTNSTVNGKRIPDGSVSNSSSTLVSFRNCRCQTTNANAIGFRFHASEGAHMLNCITEGTSCDVAVLVEHVSEAGSTVERNFVCQNHYSEFTSSLGTLFQLNLRDSVAVIDGLKLTVRRGTTPSQTVFIDDQTSQRSVIHVAHVTNFRDWNGTTDPWFVNNVPTAANRNTYIFTDNIVTNGDDWDDVGLWTNAVPAALYGRTAQEDADALDTLP